MDYSFRLGLQAGELSPTKVLSISIVEFLSWACLEAGWFTAVGLADAGVDTGGSGTAALPPSQLMPVRVDGYADGRVFEGRRSNWVWESGLREQPALDTTVSVSVDGTHVPSTDYVVDYPNGRVIFNAAVAPTAVVKAAHVRRLVQAADIDSGWVRHLDSYSLADDDARRGAAIGEGGDLAVAPSRRLQLPAIGVLPAFDFSAEPYELGSSVLRTSQSFDLVVVTETPWERTWLHDSLVAQQGVALPTFDPSLAPPPYTAAGALSPSAEPFPVLCEAYPDRSAWVESASSMDADSDGSLFKCRVRWKVVLEGV